MGGRFVHSQGHDFGGQSFLSDGDVVIVFWKEVRSNEFTSSSQWSLIFSPRLRKDFPGTQCRIL
jgi:hypothetical protein